MSSVLISAERLKELEEAESRLSHVEEKLKKRRNNNVERINAYNKAHPEKNAERVQRYKDKDREAYNARRRELRKIKKEEALKKLADPESPGIDNCPRQFDESKNSGINRSIWNDEESTM
jgi:hypothetical protein